MIDDRIEIAVYAAKPFLGARTGRRADRTVAKSLKAPTLIFDHAPTDNGKSGVYTQYDHASISFL